MWRKEIEGYKKFSDVQNRVKPKMNYNETKIGRHIICFSDELQELLYEWIKYPKNSVLNIDNVFRWIINRAIGFLLYNRFIGYVKSSKSCINTEFIDIDNDKAEVNMPFFVFLFPEENDNTCKMHYWIDNNVHDFNISAYGECPLKTKSSRRRDKENQAFQYYKHNLEIGAEY